MSTSKQCAICGDEHEYDAKACENFLTFGQGGADFVESQRLAGLYDEEAMREELQRRGFDLIRQAHERDEG